MRGNGWPDRQDHEHCRYTHNEDPLVATLFLTNEFLDGHRSSDCDSFSCHVDFVVNVRSRDKA